MNIALIQNCPIVNEIKRNRDRMGELIDMAMANESRPDLIVLAETWPSAFDYTMDAVEQVQAISETYDGKSILMLRQKAEEHHVWIAGGSIALAHPEEEEKRCTNTFFLIDSTGTVVDSYDKVHLCKWVEEDVAFRGGEVVKTMETEFGKMGVVICYDIRFPEQIRIQAANGAKLLIIPACFSTRLDHWRLLVQARAVENQIFVAACNCCGESGGVNHVGHSMVVDPSGEILAEASDNEEILYVNVDFGRIDIVRSQVSYLLDRRPDIYQKYEDITDKLP